MRGKDRGGSEARDDPRELNRDNTRPKGKTAMRGTSINIKSASKRQSGLHIGGRRNSRPRRKQGSSAAHLES